MNCPYCGAEMSLYDGGEAQNYQLEDVWFCPECGEAFEDDELDELEDIDANPPDDTPSPADLPF